MRSVPNWDEPPEDMDDPRIECNGCGLIYDCQDYAECPRCFPRQGRCGTCGQRVPELTHWADDPEGQAARGYCSQECLDEPKEFAAAMRDHQAPIPDCYERTPTSPLGHETMETVIERRLR